jgi:hypothetical protein
MKIVKSENTHDDFTPSSFCPKTKKKKKEKKNLVPYIFFRFCQLIRCVRKCNNFPKVTDKYKWILLLYMSVKFSVSSRSLAPL